MFTSKKILFIKNKILKIKKFNWLSHINNYIYLRYFILKNYNIENMNENKVIYYFYILKWNTIYTLSAFFQFHSNKKMLGLFFLKVLILYNTFCYKSIIKKLYFYIHVQSIKKYFFFLNLTEKIRPLSIWIFFLAKIIYINAFYTNSIFKEKNILFKLFNYTKLNIKLSVSRIFSKNLSYKNLRFFLNKTIDSNLEKIFKLLFNIIKIHLINSNTYENNFCKLFIYTMIKIEKNCFFDLCFIHSEFIFFLDIKSIIDNKSTIIKFFILNINSFLLINNKNLKKKNMNYYIKKVILFNIVHTLGTVILKIQNLDTKVNLLNLIINHSLNTIFLNTNLDFYISRFFMYVFLKIVLNFYKIDICSFETCEKNFFYNLKKINWKKPFKCLKSIEILFEFIDANFKKNSKPLKKIFYVFKHKQPTNNFPNKKFNCFTNFIFIQFQTNGYCNHIITYNKKSFIRKFMIVLQFYDIFFKEKNKLFIQTNLIEIKPGVIYQIIKLIKNNIFPKSCVFEIFRIKKMIINWVKTKKKTILNQKKKRLTNLIFNV